MIPPFMSAHNFALANQLLKTCYKVNVISDADFKRIKINALMCLPEDQQSPLRDITPSANPEDYTDEVLELAQTLLEAHKRKERFLNEMNRDDKRRFIYEVDAVL